ncbi:MAG: ABC transporter ATP-binding protein [Clostridia bacterium]|nr:ABC transporter ATP-binding protein [Clostridia bacterium]
MIEVKNITKKYGNFIAVDNISFDVKDGEIVGLLGPNGAGKSTTMNMITGFIEATEGNIIINGYDISKKPGKAKKQIGYMPEGVPSYQELTAKEFVKYMAELKMVDRKNRKEEIESVIKQTGLEEVQNKLIKNLSRGYKQRVSMAGALVGKPDVLILDEPTVGLDPKQILEIRNLIKELGKKHTIILSSHILSEVSQICERVVIINKGRIVAIDTPEKLETKTQNKNIIYVTVEDKNERMLSIRDKIKNVEELEYVKDNEDGTKQYKIVSDAKIDLRKTLFDILPKEDITIFELKKAEVSLEDAFMKLIDDRQENINKNEEEMIIDKSEEENANKADNEQQTDKIENNVEESIETTNSDNDTTTKQEKGGKE